MPAHDFNRLSSFDFEELICDLLQAEWKTRLEIFTPGRDNGIDLRAFADSKTETIIQCKHAPNTSFASLLSQLRREELPKVTALGPNRYVLVTSLGLTPENKKTLVKLFQPYLRRQADIFGRTEINALLRRHPKVETNNFKLWLTSTAVLQRVLHNAEHSQTEFEVDRVSRKVPLFVQNDAFPRAQAILDQTRVVVISGEPGIGKTTLAEMLLFAHLEQDFEPVVIESGIEEAKRLFSRTRKQIFYFDDFLGETFLHDRPELLAKNQDAALIHFIDAPHVRWTKDADGRYFGTSIDDQPETRVRTIIKWAEETKSRDLFQILERAHQNLENYWKQFSVYIAPVIDVLKELEASPWVLENGGTELHRTLFDKILDNLWRAGNYEWKTILEYRKTSTSWTNDDGAQIDEALREYRTKGVIEEYANCEELSELESLKDSLRDMQRAHRVSFKRVIKKLNVEIQKRRKTEPRDDDDDDYQPVQESKHGPENENEVRRLFGSLT